MEAIIAVVGFLGAGKTTVLKHLVEKYTDDGWNPFIVINDYENATIDAQQFVSLLDVKNIKPLSGSCICCSGIVELRNSVNRIPQRDKGITLIEANGTSDACSLMEFLGVGIDERFLPPIQLSVVDVNNWQKRGEHNELEANQVQVSSLIVLTHLEQCSDIRKASVIAELKALNPTAKIITAADMDVSLLPKLIPSNNTAQAFDHKKAHWSSCSVDLPVLPHTNAIHAICDALPKSILRVKGCAKIGQDESYTYFERKPDGEVSIRPFNGVPITGPKLLTIGSGSEPSVLENAVKESLLVSY